MATVSRNALASHRSRPKPLQIRDQLLYMLREEAYQVGDRIPSDNDLVQRLEVSRPTLREALKMLEEDRVLYCQHGRGRFLARDARAIDESITRLRGVTEMMADRSLSASARVLSLREEPAGETVASQLAIDAKDQLVTLERVRLVQDEPILYSLDIFPQSIVSGTLQAAPFEGSLLSIMEQEWGVAIDYARAAISAVQLTDEQCARIGCSVGLPWILLEQVHYTEHHRPVLFSKDYHRGDRFTFRVLRRHY